MKILSPEQFKEEEPDLYKTSKEALERFSVSKIFYVEDKFDLMNYDYLETDETKIEISKSLMTFLPMKEYFTLVLTSKSRSNVNEPYFFYKMRKISQLVEDILLEKGEKIEFKNDGNEEDNYKQQAKNEEIDKKEYIENMKRESDEKLKTLIEYQDDIDEDINYDEYLDEEGDEE